MKLLRQTARMNWWSGFVSALLIISFFQDAIGREAYAALILSSGMWMPTPAWIWILALILLNVIMFWFTNQVFPVRKKKDEDKTDQGSPPGPELYV